MVPAFQWNKYFETGLPEVDSQHRHLVDVLNRLGSEVDSSTPARIDETLDDLIEYTVYHFGCEEALMAKYAVDPGHQENHRHVHQRFIAQVQQWLATRREAGQLPLRQLVDYLSNWLVFHILGDDQAMGRQIRAIQKGRGPAEAFERDRVSDDPRTAILLDSLRRLYAGLLERNERLLAAHVALQREHADVERARQELAAVNASLEERVVARTAELDAANQALRTEQERAIQAEKMAAVGQLAAGFAHEINTPVGIAVGAVSQIETALADFRRLTAQDEVHEDDLAAQMEVLGSAATLAMANLRRAASLVQAFKRSSIDQASEAAEPFRLRALIEDDLLTLRGALKRLPVRVDIDCPAELTIEGTPGLYHQVVTNLVLNAIQHAFAGVTAGGVIRIAAHLGDGRLSLEVADNGAGMPPEVASHVFQPFFTTRRGSGGTGLGLYICYEVVTQRLGGSIRCETQPGAGARFLIELPVKALTARGEPLHSGHDTAPHPSP